MRHIVKEKSLHTICGSTVNFQWITSLFLPIYLSFSLSPPPSLCLFHLEDTLHILIFSYGKLPLSPQLSILFSNYQTLPLSFSICHKNSITFLSLLENSRMQFFSHKLLCLSYVRSDRGSFYTTIYQGEMLFYIYWFCLKLF